LTEERKATDVREESSASLLAPWEEQRSTMPPPSALMEPVEASTGERSEPGVAGAGSIKAPPDPEVAAKPTRRRFTAEYKLRILEEAEQAGPGGVGKIIRREGLYSSHLTAWRKAVRGGALGRLNRKRGRKAKQVNPLTKEVERLERQLSRTREELRRAELIIDVQGKVAGLLGFSLEDGRDS